MQKNIDIRVNQEIIDELFRREGEQVMGVIMNDRMMIVIKSNFQPDRDKYRYRIQTYASKQPTYGYIWIVVSFFETATGSRVVDCPLPIRLFSTDELEMVKMIVNQGEVNLYFLDMDLVYLCGFNVPVDIEDLAEKFHEVSMYTAKIPHALRDYEAGRGAAAAEIWNLVNLPS